MDGARKSKPGSLSFLYYLPTPQAQTVAAIPVARSAATTIAGHMSVPSIAILVKVANMPPTGVNAPYMKDWKAAARDPERDDV